MIDINYKGLQMSQMSTDVYRCLWLECHKITDQVSFWFEDTGKKSTISIFFQKYKILLYCVSQFFLLSIFFVIFIIQKHSALLHAHISKSRKIILKFFFVLFRPPTQITFFVSTNDKHFFFTFAISTNLLFLFHFLWRH